LLQPLPVQGQEIPRIRGVLFYSWQRNKLLPRDASDVLLGPPTLTALDVGYGAIYEGQTTELVTVTLSHSTDEDVTVAISTSDPAIVAVAGDTVTVPAGQTTISFEVTGLKVGKTDVWASLNDTTVNGAIEVLPAGFVPKMVSFTPAALVLGLGQVAELTVMLDYPAPAEGVGLVVSSEGIAVNVPATILVPAGEKMVVLTIDDLDQAGKFTVTVDDGHSQLTSEISVEDLTYYGLLLVEIFYDAVGGDDQNEWVKIYNGSAADVDLSEYALGYGGGDYSWGTYQLSGVLAAGECALVGGPGSESGNGNPTYTQVQDFDPDLQNSGANADGIALFHLKAGQILSDSIPLDALVYGGSNSAQLIGKDGQPVAQPHAADITNGKSLVRVSTEVWDVNPTPNVQGCVQIQ
jgi:hypothetical protein